MTIHIIYSNFLTPDGSKMSIGGIQTYITQLSNLLVMLDYKVSIYQLSSVSFHKIYNDCNIYGIVCKNKHKVRKVLFYECMKYFDFNSDLLIWGTDSLIYPSSYKIKSLAIQHGISWDKPCEYSNISRVRKLIIFIVKFLKSIRTIYFSQIPEKLVCVDYNFGNWYRAFVVSQKNNIQVIPNFTEVPDFNYQKQISATTVRIIFARRFQTYRGTRLFGNTIKRVLDEYNNIDITLAGEGPDEQWLKDLLVKYENVHFIKYNSKDSLKIHEDKHIAVIPTIGSEGTSLSLLEAMAAKCAVICTNIGGMTNIVIDNYNGLMINPDENSLYYALERLIEDEKLRLKLSQKAYETVNEGFSLNIWKSRWKEVIFDICNVRK